MREQVGEGVVAVRGAEVSPRAWGGYRQPAPSPRLGRVQTACSLPGRVEGADSLPPPQWVSAWMIVCVYRNMYSCMRVYIRVYKILYCCVYMNHALQ